ncbi:MAG: cyclic nucleotide-binding domain-containing protein [Clostridiales bacterium]|nr:cyclic nucleotide-binding domain-containing protein [Clostridiales bacterium]
MSIVEKTFRTNDIIIKEGELGNTFFRITEGNVGVYTNYGKKEQFRIAFLKAGDYFGEMGMIDSYPRSATVIAERTVRVQELTQKDLNALFDEKPEEIFKFLKHLANKLQSMTNDYAEAQELLKAAREADAAKKKFIFARLKKRANQYQPGQTGLEEPTPESYKKELANVRFEGPASIKSYEEGQVIYYEGEPGNCLYIVRDGKVGMYSSYGEKDEAKLGELTGVSFMGVMGLFQNEARNSTAVAEADNTSIEAIYQEDLEGIYKACPVKIDLILRHMSFNLRKLTIEFVNMCKEITEIS